MTARKPSWVETTDRRSPERQRVEDTLAQIKYKNWSFIVLDDRENSVYPDARMFLQVQFPSIDFVTGMEEVQKGRKWMLSPHMTQSEIVTTALKAVLTAEEHEARENFRYRGAMIFGPHIDVNALAVFVKDKENLDMRTGMWVKE